MRDADALRKIAMELRAEAERRDAEQAEQPGRVVTAMVGLSALRNALKERA